MTCYIDYLEYSEEILKRYPANKKHLLKYLNNNNNVDTSHIIKGYKIGNGIH